MNTKANQSIVTSVRTYADGFGKWRAELSFGHTLSESDNRPEFNIGHHWSNLRRKARNAVVQAISEREQKSNETLAQAKSRVRESLGNLAVIAQNVNSVNTWHGVTFGEA